MAVGKMIGGLISVPAGEMLDIQPPPDVEYVVHNIIAPSGCPIELRFGSSTADVLVDAATTSIMDVHLHMSHDVYYKIKNQSGATALIGYDGVIVYEG